MLRFPATLTAEQFLKQHWQKRPLFMPAAVDRVSPSLSRNELAWLATHEDVESRIVFVDREASPPRYRVESGPFDTEYLQQLPKRDWTLLVHDVEKHLPAMRAVFNYVPFIPDWRIDDLMVSFAAPGGGVGPHRDQYDVFLCQGIGLRRWCYSGSAIAEDPKASDDLALLREFSSDTEHRTRNGDVLYLPPGFAHWGTAERACMTYSIGMRAPTAGELSTQKCGTQQNAFYSDAELSLAEAVPGYISSDAKRRAQELLGTELHPEQFGRAVTRSKDWLVPETIDEQHAAEVGARLRAPISLHGMARLAWDEQHIYLNGHSTPHSIYATDLIGKLCRKRRWQSSDLQAVADIPGGPKLLQWLLVNGAFALSENS